MVNLEEQFDSFGYYIVHFCNLLLVRHEPETLIQARKSSQNQSFHSPTLPSIRELFTIYCFHRCLPLIHETGLMIILLLNILAFPVGGA